MTWMSGGKKRIERKGRDTKMGLDDCRDEKLNERKKGGRGKNDLDEGSGKKY